MHRIPLFAVLLLLAANTFAAAPTMHGGIAWRTPDAGASPLARDRPTLLYYGAEWCPPCRALETQVFSQPEVQHALAPFALVYIDGDRPDAQDFMKPFRVPGFPTLLAMTADGTEAARYMGAAETGEFLQFLDAATSRKLPMAMLERLERGKRLSAADWTTLSAIEISAAGALQYDAEHGAATLKQLRDGMDRARRALDGAHPPLPALVEHRIRIKALVLDLLSEKTDSDLAGHRAALDGVLEDRTAVADLGNELTYASDLVTFLHPADNTAQRVLARRLLAMFDQQVANADGNAPAQIELMLLQLPLLPLGSDDVDKVRTAMADRVEQAFQAATTPAARLALVVTGVRLLRLTGREFRAEALLRESLAAAPDAYYLHSALADFAQRRGDLAQVVASTEAAFRGAHGNPGAVTWGGYWIAATIKRDARDVTGIEHATNTVLDTALASGQVFRNYSADSMQRIATDLGRWLATLDDAAPKARLLARWQALCDAVADDKAQSAACTTALAALATPVPVAEADGDT